MNMLGLVFLGAPLAFVALSVYLLAKVQPLPITSIPQTAADRSKTRERVTA
jgi:hypothetical protein